MSELTREQMRKVIQELEEQTVRKPGEENAALDNTMLTANVFDLLIAEEGFDYDQREHLGTSSAFSGISMAVVELVNYYRRIEAALPATELADLHQTVASQAHNLVRHLSEVLSFETGEAGVTEPPDKRKSRIEQGCLQVIKQLGNALRAGGSRYWVTYVEKMLGAEDAVRAALGAGQIGDFSDLDFLAREARENASKLQSQCESANEASDRVSKILAEAQTKLQTLKDALGETGAEQHSAKFSKQAEENKDEAKLWLKVTVGSVAGMLIWVLIAFFRSLCTDSALCIGSVPATPWELAHEVFVYIAPLSVLSYCTVLCARNYKAARHNQTLNTHRANSLNTMQLFANAAADAETKAHVLRKATDAVFGHSVSGYVPGDHEATGPPSIVNIVKDMGMTG